LYQEIKPYLTGENFMGSVSIKKQTKRATKWEEQVATNVAIHFKDFIFSLVTSKNWGDFSNTDEPRIQFQFDSGEIFNMSLSQLKEILKNK